MSSKNDKLNLLPDEEKRESEAYLKKTATAQNSAEPLLTAPEFIKQEETKKEHWWNRKKIKNLNKPQVVKPPKLEKKKGKKILAAKEASAELFALANDQEPSASWWHKESKESVPEASEPKGGFMDDFSKKEEKTEKKIHKKDEPNPVVSFTHAREKKSEKPKLEKPLKIKKVVPEQPKEPEENLHEPDDLEGSKSAVGVNLVPEYAIQEDTARPWILVAANMVLILAIWVIVIGWNYRSINKAEAVFYSKQDHLTQINKLINEAKDRKDAALSLQTQFGSIENLIDGHMYWTPFLQKLEELTIPDVYYSGMTASKNGQIVLQAVAKNFDSAARQIRSFELAPSAIKSINIGEARIENQPGAILPVPVVTFDIQLELVPDILFLNSPQEK